MATTFILHQNRYSYTEQASIHMDFLEQAQAIAELDHQYYKLLAIYAKLFEDNPMLDDIYVTFLVSSDKKTLTLGEFEEWYADGEMYRNRFNFIQHFIKNGFKREENQDWTGTVYPLSAEFLGGYLST